MLAKKTFELILDAAKSMGAKTQLVDKGKGVYSLKLNNKTRFIYKSLIPLNTSVSARLARDKFLTKQILKSAGVNTPKGILIHNPLNLEHDLETSGINYPLVVKPNTSALGNMVFVKVLNLQELKQSASAILRSFKECLIEEYIDNVSDYRVLVLDLKVIAACRRVIPQVIGNGRSTVSELVANYNKDRVKPLAEDAEYLKFLKNQRLTPSHVPDDGKIVVLRGNANVATGGIVEDVTDSVSEHFKKLAVRSVESLGLRFGGVDILTSDITKKTNYMVTEINGLPSFDIHLQAQEGKIINPAPLLVEAIFN